jgi:hypothetical protein
MGKRSRDEQGFSLQPTPIEQAPPTDPIVLQKMEDARVNNEHYAAIGLVAARWAYFEAVVDTWISAFIRRPPEVTVCLTAQMIGPRPRLDAFIALARFLGAEEKRIKVLTKLAEKARGLGEFRNRAVHDVWDLSQPTTPRRLEATAQKMLRLLKVHEPTNELLGLAAKIDQLTSRFDDLASTIFTETARQNAGQKLSRWKSWT